MRTLRLARVAAEAEGLRWRRKGRVLAMRAMLAAVGVVFVLAALALAHFAGWERLRQIVGPANAAWIIAGGDLLVAIILFVLASRDIQDRIETDALRVREQALAEMRQSLTLAAMLGPLLRLLPFILGLRRRRT